MGQNDELKIAVPKVDYWIEKLKGNFTKSGIENLMNDIKKNYLRYFQENNHAARKKAAQRVLTSNIHSSAQGAVLFLRVGWFGYFVKNCFMS